MDWVSKGTAGWLTLLFDIGMDEGQVDSGGLTLMAAMMATTGAIGLGRWSRGDGEMLFPRLLLTVYARCCSGAVGWIVMGTGVVVLMGCRCRCGGG